MHRLQLGTYGQDWLFCFGIRQLPFTQYPYPLHQFGHDFIEQNTVRSAGHLKMAFNELISREDCPDSHPKAVMLLKVILMPFPEHSTIEQTC